MKGRQHDPRWRIGIDLGGTKIEALALSAEGQEYGRRRVPTPKGDYEATLRVAAALTSSLVAALGRENVAGVGVGIPGSLSPQTGLVRNANSTWLNGRAFPQDLQAIVELPLAVENDANCFALSEAADGAGLGHRTVFGVILGTGVGGGIVLDGQLLKGCNAVCGEWGHNPLPWPDESEIAAPRCYCGKRGCIETFLSGPALEQQYHARAGRGAAAKLIAEGAASGDAACEATLTVYARRLAKSLASVVNIVDPDVIVFGGGVSNIASIFDKARAELATWVFSDGCATEFKVNRWGDSSGVRGAARLPFVRHEAPRLEAGRSVSR
ncbi:MAG: ROK family protein [Bradyrhizobiaceae bacterium]|nr:ROK family protein [Bradyrhizobiaceae bacterium]